jgi:hypothetical protein
MTMTDPDFEARVREAVDAEKFHAQVQDLVKAGHRGVPGFAEAAKTIESVGFDAPEVVKDLLAASENPAKPIGALGADLAQAATIARLPQAQRIKELVKMDVAVAARRPAAPPAPPSKPVDWRSDGDCRRWMPRSFA